MKPNDSSSSANNHSVSYFSRRCTTSGTDLIATGGSLDGTVKVWKVADGSILATLRGGSSNNSILSCDVTNRLVAGGGNDKTCRVWDISTQRMVHQLVDVALHFLRRGELPGGAAAWARLRRP